ncbi:FxsA family protein [Modicisalibacter luteus]|uniref:FxsA family protein n=1 Tax=Modicisalibacter luteus TaxID=453962 RepID=A0ABV7M428_9GAMM|nr:FxsA family protein [Halomonas lutea]GHA90801.1 membrane protein FxsA [Halomonas lutea]
MPILFAFTLFALLDFVILFSVGAQIGLLMTLLLILGTGFLGLHLVRREGLATFQRAQQRLAQGEIPSDELMIGAALIFGGALLMAPGFLSDALGFMCLLPTSRRLLGRFLSRLPFRFQSFTATGYTRGSDGWSQQPRQESDPLDQEHNDKDQNQGTPIEGDFISKDEPRY